MADVLLVGTPGSLRTRGFLAAAERYGLAVVVHPWDAVLAGVPAPSARHAKIDAPTLTPEVQRALIAAGGGTPGPGDPGLRGARVAQRGFERLVARLEHELAPARLFNPASDIAVLGDKALTQARLAAHGVPTPAPVELAEADRPDVPVMVKLRWGSAAAGIVSIHRMNGRPEGFTTMTPEAGGWYSSRRVRRVAGPALRAPVAWLVEEGAHAEAWHAKDRIDGQPYDLRVLAIDGRPAHVVGRASTGPHPFTNLHLGGRRIPFEVVRAHLGPERTERVLDVSRRAAACFPACRVLGLDVMWTAEGPRVIEANAFGDLLNDVLWEGLNPWEAQLATLTSGRGGPR
ncbi:MAG: STM4014 family protein [Alphaproteobacteria bacterium]|nr:STM4014 family protein [Alphaproteobacteria bacterium]